MRMDPEDVRKLVKRICIIAAFFAAALLLYFLGRGGPPIWRSLLLAYAMIVTVIMVLAILIQSGRGGGLAGLGGAGGDSLIGARAATPIAKATYVLGFLLLFICVLLARMQYEAADMPPTAPAPQDTAPVTPDGQDAPDEQDAPEPDDSVSESLPEDQS